MSLVITDPATLEHLRQAEWAIELRGPAENVLGHFRPLVCSLDDPTSLVLTDATTVEQLCRIERWVEVQDPVGHAIGRFEPLVCKPVDEEEPQRSRRPGEGRRLKDILKDLERRYGS